MKTAAIIFALLATPAFTQTVCDDLNALADGGQNHLVLAGQSATCRSSLGLAGERHMHCNWAFPYRSATATSAFGALTRDLNACLGPGAVLSTDQNVNHPDAFDLQQFVVDGRDYAVSIKDKGALQQTHVFVRVQILP